MGSFNFDDEEAFTRTIRGVDVVGGSSVGQLPQSFVGPVPNGCNEPEDASRFSNS
jgi:hypothetical protein